MQRCPGLRYCIRSFLRQDDSDRGGLQGCTIAKHLNIGIFKPLTHQKMTARSSPLLSPSHYQWVFKYKLYHLPFWVVYHFLWATVKTGDPLEVATYVFASPSFKFIFYVVFQAVAVYFNLYFLIPRLLEKSRFVPYIACLLLTILATAAIIVPGYHLGAWVSGSTATDLYGTSEFAFFFLTYTLPSTVASTTLAMSVKLTKNWIQAKRREQLLEKEKLETELKFLKSQFNPHFLFNTINSIFVLIHKNPAMASESLSKFSDLLRYQLYECNESAIPLSQELGYLENYIELEKLRHDAHNLELTVDLEHAAGQGLAIAPFVLIPFIENAFKHVSRQKNRPNWITMHLHVDQQQLHFTIANSIAPEGARAREVLPYRGIGLQNVQRRLDLIYPGAHTLNIKHDHLQFSVHLSLRLQQDHAMAATLGKLNITTAEELSHTT